jgi:hypothetical protein
MLDPDPQLSQDEYEGDSWLTDDGTSSDSSSVGDSADGDPDEK